jgi:hypothetical protein
MATFLLLACSFLTQEPQTYVSEPLPPELLTLPINTRSTRDSVIPSKRTKAGVWQEWRVVFKTEPDGNWKTDNDFADDLYKQQTRDQVDELGKPLELSPLCLEFPKLMVQDLTTVISRDNGWKLGEPIPKIFAEREVTKGFEGWTLIQGRDGYFYRFAATDRANRLQDYLIATSESPLKNFLGWKKRFDSMFGESFCSKNDTSEGRNISNLSCIWKRDLGILRLTYYCGSRVKGSKREQNRRPVVNLEFSDGAEYFPSGFFSKRFAIFK